MTREELVNKACSYIKPTPYPNPNDITRWFWGNDLQHAWCGAFVDYVVKHDLGCDWLDSCTKENYVGGFGYVPSIVNWAKNNGYWSNKGQKGDLVIYNWNPENKGGLSHVGIVCDVSNTTVTSVDGNTVNDNYDHDCVAKRVRSLKYVVGYVNLPYKEEKMKYKVGDKVIINGNLYVSSNASKPSGYIENRKTNITRVAQGTKHPYNTTNDLGWMDESDIKPYEEPVTDYKELYEKELLINKDLKAQLELSNKKIEEAIKVLNA